VFADEVALDRYTGEVHEDGVAALIDCVLTSDEPITIVAIGPFTNVAAALEREPVIFNNARVVGMHGSIRGYPLEPDAGPVPEFNVVSDIAACRAVFAAGWDVTITPLDTCGSVVLFGDHYRTVRELSSPLMQTVARNYDLWVAGWLESAGPGWLESFSRLDELCNDGSIDRSQPYFTRASTVLFDTVAIYLAYDESLLNVERLPISVDDDGVMHVIAGAPELRVATSWRNRDIFADELVERLVS
jgi:inosine-uridine nucleoside N-ribohydrolase